MTQLRITEIFHSLQGEAKTMGRPTVFVRLTGCPLRCHYCDTSYAFSGGHSMDCADILAEVASFNPHYVTVTGGEPLAQPGVHHLLTELCNQSYQVSLETSGALDIGKVDPRISVVLDLKTPQSGECERNLYENIQYLKPIDQVKFVICSRADYQWARLKMDELELVNKVEDILFSPSFGQLEPRLLADWIIQDNLPVRFQLQLHKLLWSDQPGH